jgi:ABC-type polysaccharide/polyol phosphate export permease
MTATQGRAGVISEADADRSPEGGPTRGRGSVSAPSKRASTTPEGSYGTPSAFKELRNSRELFNNLTLRELRSKYKRSWLGWTWSMINPLAYTAIYTIVFKYFLHAVAAPGANGLNVYALWLLCALLPWNFFQTAVTTAIGSLTGNANLIKKSYFPRQLLPIASVSAALVSHFIEMGLLVVALLAFGDYQSLIYLPMTVFLILVMVTFAIGLGLLLGVLNVYFRDVEHFMMIFFLVWMYLTPIVYSPSYLHGKTIFIIKLNPITDATIAFRNALYYGTMPGPFELAAIVIAAVVALVVGWVVFCKYEGRLAEEL